PPSLPNRHLHSFPTRRSSDLKGAHGGAFGRGEEAAIDPAHDEKEEGGHRPHVLERQQALAPARALAGRTRGGIAPGHVLDGAAEDRKSTRLNSSHVSISYAVF